MLHISSAQIDVLAVPFDAQFRARVLQFVRHRAPELVEGAAADVDARLDAGLRDARALGIVSEQELVLYVILCLLHGTGFTEGEVWAKQVVQARRDAGYVGGLPQALMEAGHSMPAPGLT